MARVTDAEVKEILTTTLTTTAFITAANLTVTRVLGTSLNADELKEIERWLAAHLTCMNDPRERAITVGAASAGFEGDWGLGLDHTRYGQQVKILDTTGKLAALGRRRGKVTVVVRKESA